MYRRQSYLPTFSNHSFFCLPESVGWYKDWPYHWVDREEGEWESFSIHLVISGKGCVETDDDVITLEKGDSLLYFPKQRQKYYSSKNDPWNIRWIHFYGGPELKQFLINGGYHRSTLWKVKTTILEPLYHELLEEVENNQHQDLARLSILTYSILAEFFKSAVPFTAPKNTEVTDRLLKLLPKIREDAHLPFVLEEWAEKAEISQFYFCRLFRKVTLLTPLEFITMCRLQKAKQLLLEKQEWSIKRIAIESGYKNVNYFNKRFRENTEMTPTEYRKQLFAKETYST